MSAAVSYERVRDQLGRLKMQAALTALDGVLERAQKNHRLTVEVLDELLTLELGPYGRVTAFDPSDSLTSTTPFPGPRPSLPI